MNLYPVPDDLRQLIPSVTQLLARADVRLLFERHGTVIARPALETAIEQTRSMLLVGGSIQSKGDTETQIAALLAVSLDAEQWNAPRRVINATGVLLHTGLGRAPLAEAARNSVLDASGACQLEVDPVSGDRSYRGFQVASLLRALTGAEDSLIVNNNAGATLLVLQALCRGREVIISRGQLVEIGGSFRLPEIFAAAGVTLKEVGTTNRTHLSDYESAISDRTIAILKVHTSNYRIIGFTSEPTTAQLASVTRQHGLLLFDDIGSGQLFPHELLQSFEEPDFRGSLAAKADVALGSGDKLLGGPQAGIILGRSTLIDTLRRHPLARCLRIDKLNLAALHATLLIHAGRAASGELPLFRMLSVSVDELRLRASAMASRLDGLTGLTVDIVDSNAEIGGGTCAGRPVPSVALKLRCTKWSAEETARQLRCGTPAVWGRTSDNSVLLDLRAISPTDDADLTKAILRLKSADSVSGGPEI